jgi:hypothetical protein
MVRHPDAARKNTAGHFSLRQAILTGNAIEYKRFIELNR